MKELSLKASSLGSETAEGIVVVTTWIRPIQNQANKSPSIAERGEHEVSRPGKKLLALDSV